MNIYSRLPPRYNSILEMLGQDFIDQMPKLSKDSKSILNERFTNKEILDAISQLGDKKAAGIDGVPNILIKNTASIIINLLCNAFNAVQDIRQDYRKQTCESH